MEIVSPETLRSRVGEEIGVSDWFEIDQARINAFAEVTEDHQFIHVDPEKAKETPFGGAIAHGFLTLSMLSPMAYDVTPKLDGLAMGVNYGFEKIRFISPVPAGARVRTRFVLQSFEAREDSGFQFKYGVTVEIEGVEKPALIAEWLSLQYVA